MRSQAALFASLAFLGLGLASAPARAGNDSIVTLGVGSHTVVSQVGGVAGSPSAVIGGQGATLRLRALYLLGVELSYQWTSAPGVDSVNVPKPVFQLSALIYPYTSQRISVFVLAGLGGTSFVDAFSLGGTTTSYHGGLGLEVGITRHWIVAADGRINLPGYALVMTRVDPNAILMQGTSAVTRYYNADSFQINLGIRYYL